MRDRLAARGKSLVLTKQAREFLIDHGFDQSLGARPLRRAVERYIENPHHTYNTANIYSAYVCR